MSSSPFHRHLRERHHFERRDPRFGVSAACRFWWPSLTGESAFGLGQTTDLGIGGVSVLTSMLPPLGSPVMLEVDLPRFDIDLTEMALSEADLPEIAHDHFLLLTAEGTVLRHHGAAAGFSAVLTQTSFVHQEKRKFA